MPEIYNKSNDPIIVKRNYLLPINEIDKSLKSKPIKVRLDKSDKCIKISSYQKQTKNLKKNTDKIYAVISLGVLLNSKIRKKGEYQFGGKIVDHVGFHFLDTLRRAYRKTSKKVFYYPQGLIQLPIIQYSSNDIEILKKKMHEHVEKLFESTTLKMEENKDG